MTERTETFEGWAILELMGHRRLAGFLREQEIAGAAFIRIDVPGEAGLAASQFYATAAVYCITPTTEEVARQVAKLNVPEPVHNCELPAPKEPTTYRGPLSDRDNAYPHDDE